MRILAALLFISAVCFGQGTGAKNCSVDGSVMNSVTGAPIARAHVSVAADYDARFADSDAAGQWKAEHLACGPITFGAERVGFLLPRSKPVPVSLVADTPLHNIKLELTPQAVLAGRVVDDQGDPVLNAQVTLLTSRVIDGLRGIQPSDSDETNDLGEYRFAGLSAGKYVLCAEKGGSGPGNATRTYGRKCYPGPVDTQTSGAMDVAAGYEGRIDFALLPLPLATVHVSGIVSGLPKSEPGQVTLMWLNERSSDAIFSPVREDGTFSIGNVPSGSYVLSAGTSQDDHMTTHLPLEVGTSDIEGLQLHPQPGFEVTGTVKIVSSAGRTVDRAQYIVTLKSSSRRYLSEQMRWDKDRTAFTINDVERDSYRLEFVPPAPFYVKSATLGGRDMIGSEVPIGPSAGNIEIVISDDSGAVEGDVVASDAAVPGWILLERDGKAWRNVRSDPAGHFKLDTVPPGEYKVYAWDDNTNVEYANPDWMKRYGNGVAVTVAPGQTAAVKVVRQTAPGE